MFFKILRKLQASSPEKRQLWALFISITTTAMIFGFWLTTFNQKPVGEITVNNPNVATVEEAVPSSSPFSAIIGTFKDLAKELSNRFGEFTDQISNFQKTEVWNSYSSSTIQQTLEIKIKPSEVPPYFP